MWHKSFSDLRHSETELNTLIEQYPQVGLFKSMRAKLDQQNSSPLYARSLKKAAIFSPDRKKLYSYIVQPSLTDKIDAIESEVSTESEPQSGKDKKTNSQPDLDSINTQGQPEQEEINQLEEQLLNQVILQHAVSSSIELEALPEVHESAKELQPTDENQDTEEVEIETIDGPIKNMGLLDWIKQDRNETAKSLEPKESDKEPQDLINTFIKNNPQRIGDDDSKPKRVFIDRPKQEFFSPENMAKMSLVEDDEFITETLAGIYAKQGNITKAKKAYEKLSLKFPEKRDYFARLIQELGNKQ